MNNELTPESMQLIADLLKTLMPPNWGFTLVTFETNTPIGKTLYISNANRDDMKNTLQSLLDKWNKSKDFLTTNPN